LARLGFLQVGDGFAAEDTGGQVAQLIVVFLDLGFEVVPVARQREAAQEQTRAEGCPTH